MFNPYGSIRNIVSTSDAGAEVQDDASRLGINFNTFGPIKVFGTAEWGVIWFKAKPRSTPAPPRRQGSA
jgi:hypothetical protein